MEDDINRWYDSGWWTVGTLEQVNVETVPSIFFYRHIYWGESSSINFVFWNLLLFQIRFCTARYLIVIVTLFPSKCVYLYQAKIDEKLENWEKSSLRSSPNLESMTQHTHQGPDFFCASWTPCFSRLAFATHGPQVERNGQDPTKQCSSSFQVGKLTGNGRILPWIYRTPKYAAEVTSRFRLGLGWDPGTCHPQTGSLIWTSTFFWREKVFLKNRQHVWEFPTSGLFCYHLQKIDSENIFFAWNCPISPPFLALVRPWFSLTDQWNLPLKSGWKIVASLKRDFCC